MVGAYPCGRLRLGRHKPLPLPREIPKTRFNDLIRAIICQQNAQTHGPDGVFGADEKETNQINAIF